MRCGRKKRVVLDAEAQRQVVGPRYLRLIEEHLHVLHDQPAHGNRGFFLDQLVIAHLLAFFNPTVQGLRSIEDLFEDPKRRKRFGLSRAPKSTVADAQRLFDPDLLLPLIDSLVQRVQIQPHDRRLDELTKKLLAVDGSFFAVAPRIRARMRSAQHGPFYGTTGQVRTEKHIRSRVEVLGIGHDSDRRIPAR